MSLKKPIICANREIGAYNFHEADKVPNNIQ